MMSGLSLTDVKLNTIDDDILSEKPAKFDVFLSYDKSIQDKILKLYTVIISCTDILVSLDLPDIDMSMKKKYTTLLKNMLRSRLVVCCINVEYCKNRKCKDQLLMAYTNSRPILLLMLEELKLADIETIHFATKDLRKIFMYDFLKQKNPFKGPIAGEVIKEILNMLGREIQCKQNGEKRRSLFAEIPYEFHHNFDDSKSHSDNSTHSTSYENKEVGEKTEEPTNDIEYEEIFLNPERFRLKHLTTNSLFINVFGFNRMIWFEPKQRFLVTSAYNKAIILLDYVGTWMEKKNPNSMLKCPWGICINKINHIFVGDNELKCIFIFDQNFKYLRTIGQNFTNGYYDLLVDDTKNLIYVADMYDSAIIVIDIFRNTCLKAFFASAPAYLCFLEQTLVVLNANDKIQLIDSVTFEVKFKFEIKNSKYLSGLCTFDTNTLFLTAHEVLMDNTKTRNVCLCIIKISDDRNDFSIKKINLDELDLVTDMVMKKTSMLCINDTHATVYNYSNIEELLNWEEEVKNENS